MNLPPEQAATLPRLRRIAALKSGRARNQPVRIVWHDSPDTDLLQSGLAAAEQRGVWRLELVLPNGAALAPAAPSTVVREAATAAALDTPLPSPLMPIAAFDGRAIGFDLNREGETIALRLLDGVVRGVTAERRTARVQLAGDGAAVVDLALDLAGELDLDVPAAALAAEAIAAARAAAPAPRRLGAPALGTGLSVEEAFGAVNDHLTDVMVHWAGRIRAEDEATQPVHQMRVALRRLRSAFSLFRPAVGCAALAEIGEGLKTLGRMLGPARDWDVFCTETGRAVSTAFPDEAHVARLLSATERRRREHYRLLRAHLDGSDYRRLMIRLATAPRLRSWETDTDEQRRALLGAPLRDFAAGALAKRHKRLQQAGAELGILDLPALHGVRLLAKRMRYASEICAPLFPAKASRRFIRRLSELQETLGALNDGAMAAGLLTELGGAGTDRAFAIGVVRGYVAGRGTAQRRGVRKAWSRLSEAPEFWA